MVAFKLFKLFHARPLTKEELLAGIAAMEAQRGKGSDAEAGKPQNTQEQTWPQ
ncbi:hypothetical protein CRENPOLYSF1_220017 [Crenothrix polyspora]|uniref:Uncharacterized protein n=1 Tax=Crenothrix polyspora TaxID=360316 RepID=A0A1R4H6G7_9GAMM|nr:hypothetical protein CRENPOLYSF1_220017 [Crenothrix polyspora]